MPQLSEAARSLCITQSTLSQQIKQLENEFDTLLFERTSHSVALTEAGRELLPVARKAISAADDCRSRIDDLRHEMRHTQHRVTYSFSPILTESIVTFMKMYPGIKLNVLYKPMSELMEAPATTRSGFRTRLPTAAARRGEWNHHILFQSYLAAIVRPTHSLASHSRLSLHDLQPYDLALPPEDSRHATHSTAWHHTSPA